MADLDPSSNIADIAAANVDTPELDSPPTSPEVSVQSPQQPSELEKAAERQVELRHEEGPPGEVIEDDEDLLSDYPPSTTELDLIHLRITSIPALNLSRFPLRHLCLRQNRILDIEGLSPLSSTLEELDLYDNAISHIHGLEDLHNLTSLDLSFNNIKHIKRLEAQTKVTELFFVQNRVSRIENLGHMKELKNLELGANKIREIEGLEELRALEELWLGKNKITELKGLDTLSNLRILSIQSNRLTKICNLEKLASLEELYMSHNALTEISGLEENKKLRVLDVSNNEIAHLSGLKDTTPELEELWASNNKLESFEEVEKELGGKEKLETVYFEGNPLQRKQPVLYRGKVRMALPRVRQIDAVILRT